MASVGALGEETEELPIFDITDLKGKENFLSLYSQKHKELGKRQREYKKTLTLRYKSRNDTIVDKSYMLASERLLQEQNDLRAQIWVANSPTHVRQNDVYLTKIQCHVECQEILAARMKLVKKDVVNMERGLQQINKQIYDLNMQTVPESQHQAHVAATRKKLALLENRLEVAIRQESIFLAANAALRHEISDILYQRKQFYDAYTRSMQNLTKDRKYLRDLMECCMGFFESCIEAHEKIEMVRKREHKEDEARKLEAQAEIRNKAASLENDEFVICKGKQRRLADLQPKEYRRRQKYVHFHQHKINLYKNIMKKLLAYMDTDEISDVTDIFQQQESLYYSYFSYANEMGYHVTLLDNSVNRLYAELESKKIFGKQSLSDQIRTISELEAELAKKKQTNLDLAAQKAESDRRLNKLYSDMNSVVIACKLNTLPLMEFLSDHSRVNLQNVRRFTKALEKRVKDIVAVVFYNERAVQGKDKANCTVKDIYKCSEIPTDIRDIVMTQQCPECGEGEIFNADDMADSSIRVLTIEEAKQQLFERVKQPEMQYRLHNLSECRLPRSRILIAKRNA